jgi:hypothetical protein
MKTATSIILGFVNPADEENERNRRAHQASVREYAVKLKNSWHRRIAMISPDLGLKFRSISNSKNSESVFAKFTFIHQRQDLDGLELVVLLSVDQDIGFGVYAKKIRAVTRSSEYRHTAKDEQIFLSTDPNTFVDDLYAMLRDHNSDLNKLAKMLYHDAVRHIGERHIENGIPHPEVIVPFDYAQEMLRYLKSLKSISVQNHCELVPSNVAALKDGNDAVVKFNIIGEGWPSDAQLCFYVTVDELFNAAAIRKVRVVSKSSNDYSDSDEDHPVTLQPDPQQAATELVQEMTNDSLLSMVVIQSLMRAKHFFAGGNALD